MSLQIEKEYERVFSISYQEIAQKVTDSVIASQGCPYECQINLLLTDNDGIREINQTYRNIDAPTDVLSFPLLDGDDFEDFQKLEQYQEDYFDPESGELLLGDIIISVDKVYEQADKYGHSPEREFGFLVAHSMLHLFGYDHMEPEEAVVMEQKQREILDGLGLVR